MIFLQLLLIKFLDEIFVSNDKFYEEISEAIVSLDKEKTIELANKAIQENMNLLEVIEKGFGAGIRKIGDLWDEGEFFLPELMLGGTIMQEAMQLLFPHIQTERDKISNGKVVMATIEGDIHSIGKTIVATMLSANGFEVSF
jgi:trimethylamine corrinoid protein